MGNYDQVLSHALGHNLNVILIGKHGVGKTAIVKKVFEDAGLKWRYFSASTMDPWVDFIGVPKEQTDENGQSYLGLVRPKEFADDEVEAIFFDELNRSHKKIRNAIMELIQFGSINGKEFKNLKVIWAAINPDDDEDMAYDVEKLDPAQLDRFQIQIDMPYQVDVAFFENKFGANGKAAVKWWNQQNPAVQEIVSPRRLEYAVECVLQGGDVRYVFNSKTVNASQFQKLVAAGDPEQDIKRMMAKSEDERRRWIQDHNTWENVRSTIFEKDEYMEKFLPLIPNEELLAQLKPSPRRASVADYVSKHPSQFAHVLEEVLIGRDQYHRSVLRSFQRMKDTDSGKPTPKSRDEIVIAGQTWKPEDINIVVTGHLSRYDRTAVTQMIEDAGANFKRGVTHTTTHVLIGNNPSKHKMRPLEDRPDIKQITEDDFIDAFGTGEAQFKN